MSDTMFWILVGVLLVIGFSLVSRIVWLQYREWKLFSDLVVSDSDAAARRLVRQ